MKCLLLSFMCVLLSSDALQVEAGYEARKKNKEEVRHQDFVSKEIQKFLN